MKLRLSAVWFYLFSFAVWAVSISGIFGNSGILQAYRLSHARRESASRVGLLEQERDRLKLALADIENDPFMQEQAIREVLGFVRSSELVLEFKGGKSSRHVRKGEMVQ